MTMKIYSLFLTTIAATILTSCNSKKDEYDPYKISGGKSKQEVSKNAFEVDFKATDANVKTIHINLNGSNSYDALFDTGCSTVSISLQELKDMMKQGTISAEDVIGYGISTIADGSNLEEVIVNLREISIVDKNGKAHTLRDIHASVVPNERAAILIGSSVIDNLAKKSYTVDLKKKVIRFE